jgi:orotidine-5'-phosphate decarboxylase
VALEAVIAVAREAGLLVVADGKRGDVPTTASAYGQALVGEAITPWGPVEGLGADAFTANPLLGADALEPLVEAARGAGAGVFSLVRTSNPGAAELQDAQLGASVWRSWWRGSRRSSPVAPASAAWERWSAPRPQHTWLGCGS